MAGTAAKGELTMPPAGDGVRFANGKLIEYSSVLDSFDAAEQMLGREIDISGAASGAESPLTGAAD